MVFRKTGVAVVVIGAVLAAAAAAGASGQDRPAAEARPSAVLLERLLRVPPQISVLQVSSHNKKGENGDSNWPLYKDGRGDDVIFDTAGPGCVKSMWGTAFDPNAVFQFYFDGEPEPRIRVNVLDLYKGKHPLFPAPLVSYERRGNWGGEPLAGNSFVPIPFAKRLKISVKGESRFFHIIYEKYPVTTNVVTFTGREDRAALLDAFGRMGEPLAPSAGLDMRETNTETVEPGTIVPLLKVENASGIVREIVIEADGSEAFFQKTRLRMRWDGHTRWDVEAPPGVFFGSAVRADDVRALPLRVEKLPGGKARLSAFFPMPFWDKAEIEWANTSDRPMAPLKARVAIGPNAVPRDRGTYFATLYRAGETSLGRDWTFFEGRGTGWFLGAVQSMMHSHYCEGNEHFTMDGAVSPQFNGTGTEDYYLACFWPNVDFDTPFGGVAGDIQAEGGGDQAGAYHVPASYSRFHLEAPIPFFASIDARIQHGGRSDIVSDYRSLGFAYIRRTEALSRTDAIAVGNRAAEKLHGYAFTKEAPVVRLEAFPEGESFEVKSGAAGRIHDGGEVRFRVAVGPDNRGVRLRRRLDQAVARQKALVYVDGAYAGCWYDAAGNEFLRWADSDFEFPEALTRGKSTLDIRLAVIRDGGEGPFTVYGLEAFCYKGI